MSPDKSKQLATPSTTTIKNVTDTKHTNNDVTSNNSKSIDTIIPSLKDPPPTPKDKTDSSDSSNITSIENVCMNGSTPLKEEAAAATNTADVNNVMAVAAVAAAAAEAEAAAAAAAEFFLWAGRRSLVAIRG